MKNNMVLKAGIGNFLGTFLLKGIGFLTIPLFTRMLTTTEYGYVSICLTYVSIGSILVGLSLNSSINNARFDYKYSFSAYLSSIMFLSLMNALVLLFLAACFRNYLCSFLDISYGMLCLVVICSFFQYVITTFQMTYIVDFKYRLSLAVAIFASVSGVILSVIFILACNNRITARMVGYTLPYTFIGMIVLAKFFIKGKKFISLSYWKYALTFAVPNIFHQLAHNLMSQFDRFAILKLCGQSEVALYSLIYNIGMIIQIAWSSINSVWVAWLYRQMRNNDYETVKKASRLYIQIFTVMTNMALLVSIDAVRLLAPPEYYESRVLTIPVIGAVYIVFLYSFFVNIEFFYRKAKFTAIGTALAALINIVSNMILIPLFNYQAAAYTTLLSYVCLFLFHYFIYNNILKDSLYKINLFFVPTMNVLFFAIISMIFINHIWMRYLLLSIYLLLRWKKIITLIQSFIVLLDIKNNACG